METPQDPYPTIPQRLVRGFLALPKLKCLMWVGLMTIAAFVVLVCAILSEKPLINFDDDPALLIEVSEAGVATLDKMGHSGRIIAPLAGVKWTTDPIFLIEAQKLIDKAQRDWVAFRILNDGTVKIWYPGESGPENLNKNLKVLSARSADSK